MRFKLIFIFPPFNLYGYNKALSRLKKKYTVTPAIKYSIFIRMPPISHYSNTFRTCS